MRPSSMIAAVAAPVPRRRALLATLAAALLSPLVPGAILAAAAGTTDAERFIKALGDRTVAALTRPGGDRTQRFNDMADILEEATDIDLIARLVLGRHWRAASEAQRREYLALFRGYARDSMAERFSAYSGGERFALKGSRLVGDDDILVSTQIFLGDGTPVSVDWRVRRQDGSLAVIDVVAEGVSMLITNRSQFDSIVNGRGVDGLIEEMRGWRGPVSGA